MRSMGGDMADTIIIYDNTNYDHQDINTLVRVA